MSRPKPILAIFLTEASSPCVQQSANKRAIEKDVGLKAILVRQ